MELLSISASIQEPISFSWRDPVTQKAIWSAAAFVMIYGLVFLASQILKRTIKDLRWRHKSRKFLYYLGIFVLVFVLIFIWSDFTGQLALVLSVIGAGLAIAFQQPLVSIVGWLYIVANRPFAEGDRIELGGVAGDIIDIGLLKTVLLEIKTPGAGQSSQSTGRLVDLPNSFIFSQTLFNYTRGFSYLWSEYPITVTMESDWERAHQLLLEIARHHTAQYETEARSQIEKMSEHYLIEYGMLSPTVYVIIQSSGVELTLRYLSPVRQVRMIRDEISRDILKRFADEPRVELAYPTMRSFRRTEEEPKAAGQKITGREE